MFNSLKSTLTRNLTNAIGWKTNRKIVVIESDDWGSIRMRDQKTFENLLNAGIRVDKSRYDSLDSLETKQDLEFLLEVLGKYKNTKGDTPKFTTNMVTGNPDFEKIEADDFQQYHKQSFLDSYQYYNQEDLKPIWFQGIDQKLIQPQFHAREHLNVQLWMRDLQNGYQDTQLAFKNYFFGLKTKTSSSYQTNYLEAYRAESDLELKVVNTNLGEGFKEFEQIFGFKSQSFIACNYVWPKEIEQTLLNNGINAIQSQRGQVMPQPNRGGKPKIKHHYTGQKNKLNQIYTVRNVLFEPFENEKIDWVNRAMNDINTAFIWRKPAIVSTHRINYVSQMSIKHRDKNLKMLNQLLQQILKKWPEVEFMSSDELYKIIK
jgi:hypothetical protein